MEKKLTSISVVQGREIRQYDLTMRVIGDGEPVTLIVAGLHGEESLSVDVASVLLQDFRYDGVNGTVKVIAPANPIAYAENTRKTPSYHSRYEEHQSEEQDMNRCFYRAKHRLDDGDVQLNKTETLAYHVLKEAVDADYVIDMHTATRNDRKIPQVRVRYDSSIDEAVVEEMRAMMDASGLSVALEVSEADVETGLLGGVAPVLGVPAVTMEVAGAEHFDDEDAGIYREAVKNILRYTGHLDRDRPTDRPERYSRLQKVFATKAAGRLEAVAEIGDVVEEGDILARIKEFKTGEVLEEVVSPVDGVVESLNMRETINQYGRVGKVATRE